MIIQHIDILLAYHFYREGTILLKYLKI